MNLSHSLTAVLACVLALVYPSISNAAEPAKSKAELWLYYPVNLLVPENLDRLEPVWRRAAAAGYTHVLIGDSKFSRLEEMDKRYFDNVERVKKLAAGLKLKLVPAVFSVGYSNDILSRDPNLAEGLPVKDTPFVVRAGEARVDGDPSLKLDTPSYKDESVTLEGAAATVREHGENARVTFDLKVTPFRCYHVSAWVKTEGHSGNPEVKVLSASDGRQLQWQNLGAKPTQDWTRHHVVFNSLDADRVNLYFGVWGPARGQLQWKDWKIEEVGLLNVLRRPGTPLVVKGEDGKAYAEGTDFEKVVDPRMGTVPYGGEYEVWHEPPAIRFTGTKPADGTKLRVSWYHPAVIYDGQVSACMAEPKFDAVLDDQARRVKSAFGDSAAGWMMNHDEIRTAGWCKACQDSGLTPGKLLARNVKRCTEVLKEVKPAQAYVWSDMFDPHHNAVAGPYYLVRGPWTGSWEGLDKGVVIMNWNFDKRDESLKFFADRGHRQIIAGYYDGDLENMKHWLASATKVKGVVGYMYTTWTSNYDQIEGFAEVCRR